MSRLAPLTLNPVAALVLRPVTLPSPSVTNAPFTPTKSCRPVRSMVCNVTPVALMPAPSLIAWPVSCWYWKAPAASTKPCRSIFSAPPIVKPPVVRLSVRPPTTIASASNAASPAWRSIVCVQSSAASEPYVPVELFDANSSRVASMMTPAGSPVRPTPRRLAESAV